MNYSAALIEPQALLELAAIVLTIIYVGKLALQDFWPKASSQQATATRPSKAVKNSATEGFASAANRKFGTIGLSAGLGYKSCLENRYQRLANSKVRFSLWDDLSQVARAGSLIFAPKRSLLNQIAA